MKIGEKYVHANISNELNKVSFYAWLLKLIPIPINVVFARLMAVLVTHATEGNIFPTIQIALIIFIGTVLYKTFEVFSNIAYEKLSNKTLQSCKMKFYKQVLTNPLSLLYSSKQGELLENIGNDFTEITGKSLSLYPTFYTSIITVLVYGLFLSGENLMLCMILIAISLIQIIPPLIVKRFLQVNYEKCRDIEGKLTDFTISAYDGFDTVKLYGLKKWWLGKLMDYHKTYAKLGNASIYANTGHIAMNSFFDNVLKYGTYAVVGVFVLWQYTTIDVGIEVITLSAGLFTAVKSIFSLYPRFAVVKTAEGRMSKWYVGSSANECIDGNDIKLSKMSFSYEGNEMFGHVDFTLNLDKITTLKGANGVGKSTLMKLLLGLLQSDDGTVKVGGANTVHLSSDSFPKDIFYLPQDDAHFTFTASELYEMVSVGTTANNIAKRFELSEETLSQTKISDLSGGERKKVFLALAFSLKPKLLFLDEPTNSIDEHGKSVLTELLQERGMGTLIITHDALLDTVTEHCYVLQKGGNLIEEYHLK